MERLEITSKHITVWISWSECNPSNSCLDADSSGEMCFVRTRFGSVTINETDIEVRQESSDECECAPCLTWGFNHFSNLVMVHYVWTDFSCPDLIGPYMVRWRVY